jgi:sulfate transport system permease protein
MSLRPATAEPRWVRTGLLGITLLFLGAFLVTPLVAVFAEAFRKGAGAYFASFNDPAVLAAIKLTLLAAVIAVPVNVVFGLAAAWAVAKFEFPGKSLLTTLIDLPLAVSPVVSGLIYVLVFGLNGWLGPWLKAHDLQVIFAVPGIVLATVFVTLPFVARELIPLMQEQGTEDEESALTLGASGWQTFWRVTLPNVRWALLYGVILCNARAMGEFGAVSVVSGHIRGKTNTVPLQVEILYNEYNFVAAFAVASLLAMLALVTLAAKSFIEWRMQSAPASTLVPGDEAVSITVQDISKSYGTFQALRGVSLEIPDAKITALLGPSGSGKTTLLRIIAGLESAGRGQRAHPLPPGGRGRSPRAGAPRGLRVPALRAVQAHDGVRERGLRAARAAEARAPGKARHRQEGA